MRTIGWVSVRRVVGISFGVLVSLVPARAFATPGVVLGKSFVLKNPDPGGDASRRRLVVVAKEAASDDVIAGNPISDGATLDVVVTGTATALQTFALPAGASWKAVGSGPLGYVYKDAAGANGPVKGVSFKKTPSGTMILKVTIDGARGPGPQPHVTVTPPAPGHAGGVFLTIGSGTPTCVGFGGVDGGQASNDGARLFKMRSTSSSSLTQAACPTRPPVCGNGVHETGEQCDGGAACTASCVQTIPACCLLGGQCVDATGFVLQFNLANFCSVALPGSAPVEGGVCDSDGTCATAAIDPVSVCCQLNGSCEDTVASTTNGLWSFQHTCVGAQLGTVHVGQTCAPAGTCVGP